jgi:hypothetical protein
LEGNMFFPLTGIPMLKIDLIKMRFADWLPVPFDVATVTATSLTMGCPEEPALTCAGPIPSGLMCYFLPPIGKIRPNEYTDRHEPTPRAVDWQ